MPSHGIGFQLFGDHSSMPEIRAVFDERAMLERWLGAGVALAQAEPHLISNDPAQTIARVAARRRGAVGRRGLRAARRGRAAPRAPFAPGKVGSSTMRHKPSPTHAERIVAIARLLRCVAATALETTVAAHGAT